MAEGETEHITRGCSVPLDTGLGWGWQVLAAQGVSKLCLSKAVTAAKGAMAGACRENPGNEKLLPCTSCFLEQPVNSWLVCCSWQVAEAQERAGEVGQCQPVVVVRH